MSDWIDTGGIAFQIQADGRVLVRQRIVDDPGLVYASVHNFTKAHPECVEHCERWLAIREHCARIEALPTTPTTLPARPAKGAKRAKRKAKKAARPKATRAAKADAGVLSDALDASAASAVRRSRT